MRGQQTSDLWWEYRKEKLTAPCLHIFFFTFLQFLQVINKVRTQQKNKVFILFFC